MNKNILPDIRPIDAETLTKELTVSAGTMGLDSAAELHVRHLIARQPTMALVKQEGIPIETKPDGSPILHKCKFCGGPAGLYLRPEHGCLDSTISMQGHYVSCQVCGCRTGDFVNPMNAILAWNRKPSKTGSKGR